MSQPTFFKKGECVTCHNPLDIPGFFCSRCSSENRKNEQTLKAKFMKIADIPLGKSAYISQESLFEYEDDFLCLILNGSASVDQDGQHWILLMRDQDNTFSLDLTTIDWNSIEQAPPQGVQDEDFLVIYDLSTEFEPDDDEDDDVDTEEDGFPQTVQDMVNGEVRYIEIEAICQAWGLYYVEAQAITSKEANSRSSIEITKSEGLILIDRRTIDTDFVQQGFPENKNGFLSAILY